MNSKYSSTIKIIKIILGVIFIFTLSYKIILYTFPKNSAQFETIWHIGEQSYPTLNYTAAEVSHLKDVKQIMNFSDALILISGIIFIRSRKLWKSIGKLSIGISSFTIIIALTSFTSLFSNFHYVLFPQGNWMFPAQSLIIQTFPIDYFINNTIAILILTTLISLACIKSQ